MEMKTLIMEATIEEFNEKSLKFTMDDIAKRLGISKKTIYATFLDKETLFLETVDYCFSHIKKSKDKILNDSSLSLIEKIKAIMIVLPEHYRHIDWRQVYVAKEKFPRIYKHIQTRIETEWESTIFLLEEGIANNLIRPIPIPIVKAMVEAAIEHFLSNPVLIEQNIPYEEALSQMIEIIMQGICTKSANI